MHLSFRIFSIGLLYIATTISVMAQDDIFSDAKERAKSDKDSMITPSERYSWPIISVGAGATFYTGGVRSTRNLSKFNGTRWAVNVQVEQRFGKFFGAKANIMYGMMAGERHTFSQFDNFQSRLVSGDVRFCFHMDHIVGKRHVLAPYFAVGVGYINYQTKSDLQNSEGIAYHLWDDGSLRDQTQSVQTNGNPVILRRDFTYETTLQKSGNSLAFPMEAGIRFKMHDFWDFGMGYTHTWMLNKFHASAATPQIDNYGYASATIYWYLGQFN